MAPQANVLNPQNFKFFAYKPNNNNNGNNNNSLFPNEFKFIKVNHLAQ